MCAIASTRNSFFGAEAMRASIAKDSEGTGGASLLQMVGSLHAAIFGFCSGGAAQIGRCLRRLEKQSGRKDSASAGLQIPDPQILRRALECVERDGSRRTHLA